MNNHPNLNKASIGMDANLAALLSYLIGIIGIIVLITEKENKFVKFHALQALLFHISFAVLFFAAFILFFVCAAIGSLAAAAAGEAGAVIGLIFYVIGFVVWIAALIIVPFVMLGGNIYSAVQAYNGRWFKIPIVGNFATRILGITI